MLTRKQPMTRGRAPEREARPDRSAEFASYRPPAVRAVMATPASFTATAPLPAQPPKLPRKARTDQAIRDSANGEQCHMRLEQVCNGRTDTTVWSHFPGLDGDRGMSLKALDAAGCYCCFACHDAIDGRAPLPAGMSRTEVVMAWMFGHLRSLVTLARKGLL